MDFSIDIVAFVALYVLVFVGGSRLSAKGGLIGQPDHEVIIEPREEPVPKTMPAPTIEPVREPQPLTPTIAARRIAAVAGEQTDLIRRYETSVERSLFRRIALLRSERENAPLEGVLVEAPPPATR